MMARDPDEAAGASRERRHPPAATEACLASPLDGTVPARAEWEWRRAEARGMSDHAGLFVSSPQGQG